MSDERIPVLNCACCGATDFTEGEMAAYGALGFRPRGGSKPLAALLLDRPERIHARKCNGCGNVQMFSKAK